MSELKYKVGDKVQVKDTSIEGTIENIIRGQLIVNYKGSKIPVWPEDVFLMESVKDEMSLDKAGQITDFEYEGLAYTLPDGYQFVDENGNEILTSKIILKKKKKEYPKTYEECLKVLGYEDIATHCIFHNEADEKLFNTLYDLKICRDAYWKIAGDEMGLGKPWEPDWSDDNEKYSIYTIKGVLTKAISCYDGAIFSFPTDEMRDAFYENFKSEIEICKELL